jgi:SSS family solute:Na+ symporter
LEQIIIVLIYLLLTVFIGIWSRTKATSSKEFDGVNLGIILCVVAGAGEWMGGTSTTGVSEYGYTYGISGAWYTIANGIGICFLAVFFARMFRSLDKPTVPGIIGAFIGKKAQVVSAVLLIFVMLAVGASQMVALGTLSEILFGCNAFMAIIIPGFVILIYTVLGGMMAVGYTNIMHLIVMYGGAVIALAVCGNQVSGITGMKQSLPASYYSFMAIGMPKVSSWIIASVLGACTAQAGLQPVLGAKDEKMAVRSSFAIAAIVAPFGVIMALLGMIAKVQFPELENAKLALPTLLMNLPPVIGGVVMASIFAAILSTASPIYLACGTLFTRDIYSLLKALPAEKATDRHILLVSKIATAVFGAICIVTALVLKDSATILDIVYFAYSIRGSLFIVLLLGIFWRRMSQMAAVLSMGLTACVGIIWVWFKNLTGHYPVSQYLTETYASLITELLFSVVFSFLATRIDGKKKTS